MDFVCHFTKKPVASPLTVLALVLFAALVALTEAQATTESTLISIDPSPHPAQVTTHSITQVQFTGKDLGKSSANASCTFTLDDKQKKNISQATPLTVLSDTTCSCFTPGDLSAGHYLLKLTIPSLDGSTVVVATHRFNVVHYTDHPPQACQSCTANECRVTKTKRHLGFCCQTEPPTSNSSDTNEPFYPQCQLSIFIGGLAPWEWVIVGVSALVFLLVVVVISVALSKKSCNKVRRYQPINDLPDHPTSQQPSILF